MAVGRTNQDELYLRSMEQTDFLEAATNVEKMPSTNASKLLVEDIWYSLLYRMVVGVQLLKTSEDIDVMVEQRTVEMVKVEDGQTMFTVLHVTVMEKVSTSL